MRDSRKAIIYLCTAIAVSSSFLWIATEFCYHDIFRHFQTPDTIILNAILDFVNNTFDTPIFIFYLLVDLLMIEVIKKLSLDSNEYHFAKYGLYGLLILFGVETSLLLIFYQVDIEYYIKHHLLKSILECRYIYGIGFS